MTRRNALGILLIAFVLLYAIVYRSSMEAPVRGLHANHQLALAQGFTENGFDFFNPQQHTYNHLSSEWSAISKSTITAEHFPIHSYLPAVIAQTFSLDLTSTFRWYILFFGFVGLYYLYSLGLLLTNHLGKSLFLVIFTASTPLFAQFQGNLNALIPAISLALAGIYFYFKGTTLQSPKHLFRAIICFVIASLSAPLLLIMLAVLLAPIITSLKQAGVPKSRIWTIIALLVSPILLDFIHFFSSRAEFGANTPLLFEDWLAFTKKSVSIYWDGFSVYLSPLHVGVLILLLAFLGWTNGRGIFTKNQEKNTVLLLTVKTITFALILSVLMPRRFMNDPAFMFEVGFIPLVFLLIFLLQKTEWNFWEKKWKLVAPLFILLLFGFMSEGNRALFLQQQKYEISDQAKFDFNFLGSGEILDLHQIPKDAKIAVLILPLFEFSQEYFIHLKRKGCLINLDDMNGKVFSACDYLVLNREMTNSSLKSIKFITGVNEIVESNGLIIGKIKK